MDNAQLEQLVEVITKQVLIALNAPAATGHPTAPVGRDPIDHVRRVVEAGAARITAGVSATPDDAELAGYIDHTLLKPCLLYTSDAADE